MNVNFGRKTLSIDSIETYAYGMSKVLNCKKKYIKCNNIIQLRENLVISQKNIKEHNPKWSQIPDNTMRMLITRGSGP